MVTAVDTSVLLDVLLNDLQHAPASIAALRQAAVEGQLVLCETTLAEIVPVIPSSDDRLFPFWNSNLTLRKASWTAVALYRFPTQLSPRTGASRKHRGISDPLFQDSPISQTTTPRFPQTHRHMECARQSEAPTPL